MKCPASQQFEYPDSHVEVAMRLHPLTQWLETDESIVLCTPDYRLELAPDKGRTVALLRQLESWFVSREQTQRETMRELCEFDALITEGAWSETDDVMVRVIAYIKENFGERISITGWAAADGLSDEGRHHYTVKVHNHALTDTMFGSGCHASRQLALLIAIVEIYERISSNASSNAGEVTTRPLWPILHREIVEYASWQWSEPTFPFARVPSGKWMTMSAPNSQRCVSAPLETICYPDNISGHRCSFANSSGVAAHTDRDQAVLLSAYELIERDALMVHWYKQLSRECLQPSGASVERVAKLEETGFAVEIVNLTLEFAPTALVICHREGEVSPRLCFGLAAAPFMQLAVEKALNEAIYLAQIQAGWVNHPATEQDIESTFDHLLFYESPEKHTRVLSLANSNMIEISQVEDGPQTIEDLHDVLVSKGFEWFVCDLNSEGAAKTGVHVIRSIIPGLVPLQFGYAREALGLSRLRGESNVSPGRSGYAPHPFP